MKSISSVKLLGFLGDSAWLGSGVSEVDLSVAERAVLELEVVEFTLKGLVLAGLAGVVLLSEDALATGNAGREVTAALSAVDVTKK